VPCTIRLHNHVQGCRPGTRRPPDDPLSLQLVKLRLGRRQLGRVQAAKAGSDGRSRSLDVMHRLVFGLQVGHVLKLTEDLPTASGVALQRRKGPCWTAAARRSLQVAWLQTCAMSWYPGAGKKSAPIFAKSTFANRKVQENFWLTKQTSNCFSPQHGIDWPLGPLKSGPVGSAADE
jgi:hypothetical protein